MKFLGLILRNMKHSRRRTILTVASITVALFLFCALRTVITAFDSAVDFADASRLIVRRSTSLVFPLPLAYRDRILGVQGVSGVTYANWFGGQYQGPENFFSQFAVDVPTYFDIYPELVVPPDQMKAFMAERTACIVGEGLARRFKWKVGDTVPLTGTIYPHPDGEWRLVIRGIYRPRTPDVDASVMYFHWDYLNQTMGDQGEVGFYVARLADASLAASVATAIDGRFANSSAETLTETEEAFQMGFISMMGNISFLVSVIGAAVLFAILLVSFNTMMMAARERTPEIAVMKTLGFTDGLILFLVMAEAALISLLGGILGCGGAWVIFGATNFNAGGMVPNFLVKPSTLALGLGISLLLGLLSGVIPAVQAARLSVVDALRKVA
jgi:putative ABC transport system permease protein